MDHLMSAYVLLLFSIVEYTILVKILHCGTILLKVLKTKLTNVFAMCIAF
jgi:hypothetical protein